MKSTIFKRRQREASWNHRLTRLRIGVPKEYNTKELDPGIRRIWLEGLEALQGWGHSIHPVSLPTTQIALSAYYVIAAAEASSNLAKYDGVRYGKPSANGRSGLASFAETRGMHLGKEVQRRILLGSFTLSAGAIDNHFIKAQKVRRLVQMDFDRVFRSPNPLSNCQNYATKEDGVDLLLTPTAPTLPPLMASLVIKDSIDTYTDDVLTVPASLAGLPAISVPVPFLGYNADIRARDGSVAGLQIIGQYGSDLSVIHWAEHIRLLILRRRSLRDGVDNAKHTEASSSL